MIEAVYQPFQILNKLPLKNRGFVLEHVLQITNCDQWRVSNLFFKIFFMHSNYLIWLFCKQEVLSRKLSASCQENWEIRCPETLDQHHPNFTQKKNSFKSQVRRWSLNINDSPMSGPTSTQCHFGENGLSHLISLTVCC